MPAQEALHDRIDRYIAARPGYAKLASAPALANGALVRGWLTPRPGNLTRLAKLKSAEDLAKEVYFCVPHAPADRRGTQGGERLSQPRGRPQGGNARPCVVLLASAEFRFNH